MLWDDGRVHEEQRPIGANEGLNPLLLHEKLLLLLVLEAECEEIRQQERDDFFPRNFGVTGRRGAAVPVEVGPARG